MNTVYAPGDTIVVDETMVPFRGRLKFRQYNPSKAHKYGIKLFKLCTPSGYTWDMKVYDGQGERLAELDLPGSTVIELIKPLLGEGRLVVTDNYYTSLPLAKYLFERKTNLLGTIRKHRVGLPGDIVNYNLHKGQIVSKQNDYITVLKWKDQRDVCMLSTCHDDKMEVCGKKRNGDDKVKPTAVIQYNRSKQGVDISDQLSSYYTCLRKSLIWYKKLAIEVVCGTLIVNTLVVYNSQRPKKEQLTMLQLRQSLIKSLLNIDVERRRTTVDNQTPVGETHKLEELQRGGDKKIFRKRCHGCYNKVREQGFTSTEASKKAKKVTTACHKCNQAFCIPCFNEKH